MHRSDSASYVTDASNSASGRLRDRQYDLDRGRNYVSRMRRRSPVSALASADLPSGRFNVTYVDILPALERGPSPSAMADMPSRSRVPGPYSLIVASREASAKRPQLVINGGSPPPPATPRRSVRDVTQLGERSADSGVHGPVHQRPDGMGVELRRPGLGQPEHFDPPKPESHVHLARVLRRHADAVEWRRDRHVGHTHDHGHDRWWLW